MIPQNIFIAKEAPAASKPRKGKSMGVWMSLSGVVIFIIIWWVMGRIVFGRPEYQHFSGFLPGATLKALFGLFHDPHFWHSTFASLRRILLGMAIAFAIGFPLGLVTGSYKTIRIATYIPVQFLRMISPLAWMPIALLVFEAFESAICFLITIATLWPIFLGTVFGVMNVNQKWIEMAVDQGATQFQLITKIYIPAILPETISSLRLSLGVAWIVLVPAEFLGVASGLGYLINDARDVMEYDRLMALVIAIGLIGFILDGTMQIIQKSVSEQGRIFRSRHALYGNLKRVLSSAFVTMRFIFKEGSKTLVFWIILDILYIGLIFFFHHPATWTGDGFMLPHAYGIFVGTMVMFTGLGAGVLWFPFLTHLGYAPTEIVPLSLFNQIMGKGSGSFKYFHDNMLEKKVVRYFIPYTLFGVLLGFVAGFIIPHRHERWLYIIFVLVVVFLLYRIIIHKEDDTADNPKRDIPDTLLRKSRFIVFVSSIFTGLLSIGNSDWLIPYMEDRFNMPSAKAVATGIFVMFCAALFYLLLTICTVMLGKHFLPDNLHILFATCSGVILGAQIGSRMIHVNWLKTHQRHAFIVMMSLSAAHITWKFILNR